ncbi:MAG: hypothetical protein ABS69_05635 [Nitrosomonadales bacterium SCN 54-20]|nr:MAG: hypothetical protein ABS69_05635 [Nitrosomonadales bacterium SCN 54-20]
MRLIVVTISMVWITSALAEDVPLTFQQPDPQSKFHDAQLHVRELMKAGRYKEASEYMPEYQRLSCEASEQKAGRSIVEGAAICARKYDHGGMSAGNMLRQQDRNMADSLSSNTVAPGITVMQRPVPGTPTVLDGSTPSLFLFDPRNDPATGSRPRDNAPTDPWTGTR